MEDKPLCIKESCRQRFEPAKEAVAKLVEELKQDRRKSVLIAIDGNCAAGKTTLGTYLQREFGGNLFHMDDFFLQSVQRTPRRLAEIGGNVDYERFFEEVLKPLIQKQDVIYRSYSCRTQTILGEIPMAYTPLNIIEGSYSLHPYFGQPYDLKIFMEITPERQVLHLSQRNNGQMLARFLEEWIPKEQAYFEQFRIREGCLVIGWR